MFGCPLYIHNTKKACFVRLRGCPYAPIHLDPPYVWMHTVCLDAPTCLDGPLYVWMPPYASLYVWTPHMFGCPCMSGCPLCLDAPICLDTPICIMLPICLDDVWMPPVHTQQKDSMFCWTKGVATLPHTFGCPLYLNNTKKACFVRLRGCPYAPIHLDAPCLDAPLYVWMPPVCLDTTICLEAPSVCLNASVCLDAPYVWMSPVCLGAPYVWTPLCMVGCPPYVWLSPCMFGCCQMYGGIQSYEGHPNIQGHPNVWGTYRHPGSLTKYAFFVLYMYSRHPNIFQTYMGVSKHMGVSTHIQGASKHRDAQTYRGLSKHMGSSKHTGGYPNI